MFSERFQAKIKGTRMYSDGAKKLIDVTLELELAGELAYGVPLGLQTINALEHGDYKRVVCAHEALEYVVKVTAPPTEPAGKPDVYEDDNARITEIALARKVDKEGEVTVVARPTLTFRVSDALALFLAHHFDSAALGWQATKRQLELNIPVDTATAAELKGRKAPKAKA